MSSVQTEKRIALHLLTRPQRQTRLTIDRFNRNDGVRIRKGDASGVGRLFQGF